MTASKKIGQKEPSLLSDFFDWNLRFAHFSVLTWWHKETGCGLHSPQPAELKFILRKYYLIFHLLGGDYGSVGIASDHNVQALERTTANAAF